MCLYSVLIEMAKEKESFDLKRRICVHGMETDSYMMADCCSREKLHVTEGLREAPVRIFKFNYQTFYQADSGV